MDSHKTKKPTKKQSRVAVVKLYEDTLKKNFIQNICIGFETATNIYLDKINSGYTIEELKDFMEKGIHKEIERIASEGIDTE